VLHWTNKATHGSKPFLGIPPTGRAVAFTGVSIFRLQDGKVVDGYAVWNPLQGLKQMMTAVA
jgi:predicted ester cyclase